MHAAERQRGCAGGLPRRGAKGLYLDLQETKVTEKGAAALQKAKPGIMILGPVTAVKTGVSEKPGEGVR